MHRAHRLLIVLSGFLSVVSLCRAQTLMLDLPRQSQHAVITQRIGITDITVNYHRPLVNGRQVWGKLVPYGQVWRAGANENTTITFTDPVTIEGQSLDKGTYGLHMIPGENDWTVIFSKMSTAWGSFSYKQDEDALRVTVKPHAAEFHDALTYDFDDVKPDSTVITLSWDKVAVPFKVAVNVNDIVEASIQRQIRGLNQYYWEGWDDAAGYFLAAKANLDEALKDEDQSIKVEERFDNLINKSHILEAMGRKDAATEFRNKALEKASPQQLYFYGRQLQGEKKQEEAFAVYRSTAKKYPGRMDFARRPGPRLQRRGRLRQCRQGDAGRSPRRARRRQQVQFAKLHQASAVKRRHQSLDSQEKLNERRPAARLAFHFCNSFYQTRHALARTIFWPTLQPNALAKSGIFESTLSIRKIGNECGLVVTIKRATSGRTLEHHE